MQRFKNAREEAKYYVNLYAKQQEYRVSIINRLLSEEYLQENNYKGLQKALYYFKFYYAIRTVVCKLLDTHPRTCLSDYYAMTKMAFPYFSKNYFISQARWYRLYSILHSELERLNQDFILELKKLNLYPI